MGIQSIRCTFPSYASAEGEQTKYSLIARIVASALGGIVLLAGIFALSGTPGLHALGTVGFGFVVIGSLILLASFCLQCAKIETKNVSKNTQDSDTFVTHSTRNPYAGNIELSNESEAILYMSISGNPAHLGHMAAMGTAIKELCKRNIAIKTAYVSLSSQVYVEEKQKKTIDKICYTYQERINFLLSVLQEAKTQNMFDSVEVEFWDDQADGYSDHPISYEKLTKANPLNKVFLITGSDLCRSASNWKSDKVAHAIIVTRGVSDKETIIQTDPNGDITSLIYKPTGYQFVTAIDSEEKSRILLPNAWPRYEHYSSTAIRTKKIKVTYVIPSTSSQTNNEVQPICKGSLKDISENTMQLMAQGFCRASRKKKIYFKSGLDLHRSSYVFQYDQRIESAVAEYDQKIFVLEMDSLDAAQKLVQQGCKVAVVNFAGADSAGGGFLDGTGGQEEKLIYRCDLANLMKYYYDEQLNCDPSFKMYPLYDHLIHTPDITVFRNSHFQVLEDPFKVGILTSAAPVSKHFCPFADSAFDILIKRDGEVDYADEKTRDLMLRTIYTQLKAAYASGYDAIVLGAFGCGAFQNPPDAVAKICHQVINTYFKGAFRMIVFAILDGGHQRHNPNGNIQPFKSYFSNKS